MPVRKVSNRGGNVIGKFPSLKMERMIEFESLIERDYLYVLDYEANVVSFSEQPLTIEYQHEGQTRHYTPDFHIVRARERSALAECKPSSKTETEENRRKFRAALAWCVEHDWDFFVVTDTQLRAGHRLENIKLMTYYARLDVPPQVKGRVYAVLESAPAGITVGDVARILIPDNPAGAFSSIVHMAFHHEVAIPLDRASLSMGSPISLPISGLLQAQEVGQ
jgi:hypothetical protein